jgi:hypothetical protein
MRDTRGATAQHAVEGPGPPLAAGSHNNKKEACRNDTKAKTRLYWSAPSNRKLCLLRSLPSLRSGRAARLRQVLPAGLTGWMRGSHWRNAARRDTPGRTAIFGPPWVRIPPRSLLLFARRCCLPTLRASVERSNTTRYSLLVIVARIVNQNSTQSSDALPLPNTPSGPSSGRLHSRLTRKMKCKQLHASRLWVTSHQNKRSTTHFIQFFKSKIINK